MAVPRGALGAEAAAPGPRPPQEGDLFFQDVSAAILSTGTDRL